MNPIIVVLLCVALFGLGGCQSTLEGAAKAFSNLTGGKPHNSFEGTYIAQPTLDEYKTREDDLSGEGKVISYSGLAIPSSELRKSHIVDAPVLNAYLRSILDSLLAQWDGTPVSTQVQVIDSQHFAPYADAYGMISVPLGMMNNVESEDEVAQLLSHELAHILLRHHERFDTMEGNKRNVSTLAEAVILANVINDTDVQKDPDGLPEFKYTPSEQGQSNITDAKRYNFILASLSDSVWNTAWQRTQEDEADLLGMDLAVAAGYAPRAGSYTLQRLADFQGKQEGLLDHFWESEQAALKQSFTELNIASISQQADGFIQRGANAVAGSLVRYFERSHMSPNDRDLNLRDYVRREYPSHSRQRPGAGGLTRVLEDSATQNILTGYQLAFAAASALADNDLEQAETLALQAINSDTRHHPGIREVMYNLRMAQGDPVKARQNLDLVEGWQFASPDFLRTKIERELQDENYQGAIDIISLAETNLGNEAMFTFEKVIALNNLGRRQEAMASLEQCLNDHAMAAVCKRLLEQSKTSA